MSITGIQGQPLEVTVVACSKLKDTEWISRQDPYVCLEYASTKFRTRTCTDGGKNPLFHEKFVIPLIEGLRELTVIVWNSNTLSFDDFIGTGKVQLHKVLSEGFDDSAWPLQSKTGRYAGEVKLILHYANAAHTKATSSHAHAASTFSYVPATTPHVPYYAVAPQAPASPYPQPHPAASYCPEPRVPYPLMSSTVSYPPAPTAYPASSPYHQPSVYPPSSSFPPTPSYPPTSAYPPPPYPPSAGYHPGIYPPAPY